MNPTTIEHDVPQTETNAPASLQIKTILVPLDFSRSSMQAIKFSIGVANEFGAAIHLVHVQPTDEFTAIPGAGRLMLNCADAIALMQDRLADVQPKHDFWPDTCHVVAGRPYEEICRLADELHADLIVMPTRGHTGLKHLALGSTAERVVQHASCPVLIPRGPGFDHTSWKSEAAPKFLMRTVLVPCDFSELSLVGLKYAAGVASHFDAKLRLLHVVFPYTEVFQMDRLAGEITPLMQAARARAESDLATLRQRQFSKELRVETKVRCGSVIDEICAETTDGQIDLLITSTHGRTGLSHVLIGSTAEQIVRYAECPVFVVPCRRHEWK